MIKVGITGGIGSGKSTVCNFFRLLGIPVFEADKESKKLVNTSPKIKNSLKNLFGKDIYLSDDTIDRKRLAGLIFNSPPLLETVNSIIHPEVRNYFEEWCEKQNSPYIVYEAAILFETGFYKTIDLSILVTAPVEDRIKRVIIRENATEEEVKSRISKQWTDKQKEDLADFIIKNNNEELLIPQLLELDKKIRTHG